MAKERLKSPRARLFVALDLPEEVRSGIEAWGREALGDPALRPLPAASLHITLAFLGYRPEKEIGRIGEIVEAIDGAGAADRAARPGRPAPSAAGRGCSRSRSSRRRRVVAAGGRWRRGWSPSASTSPRSRPFWPHLTVARVRPEARGSKRPRRVESPPGPLPQGLLQPVSCVRVALYRSELKPQGAQYTPLAQVEL